MRFPPIRYLAFAKQRLDVDPPGLMLASSAMQAAGPADLGLPTPEPLPISGMNAYGHPRLKELLAAWYGVATDRVLTAAGTSLANFLVMAALVEEGDLALCERPAYEPLPRVLEGLGARIAWVDRPADAGFQPDLDAIGRGFRDGARLLVLTDLHNPSAALLDRGILREIACLAEAHGAWVLVDEVYLTGVFDREVESAVRASERVIITGSLTKTWGLGLLRAGWAIAPPAIVDRCWQVNDHLGVESAYIADELAIRALERIEALTDRARRRRAECLPIVGAFAREHDLRWYEPAGGFIAWLGLPGGVLAGPLADHLRAAYDTQVTPGDFFGVPDHIRLGFGIPPEQLRAGLDNLASALVDLSSR
jgi:aspartate/methionine/tyrosine aminotransferase